MRKTLHILGFFAALNLSLFSASNTLAASLIIEVPEDVETTTQTIAYECKVGTHKKRVEAIYLNADNISLVDFIWNSDRVIATKIISNTGIKYAGGQYIWWKKNNEVTLYDLVQDPEEKKPILCIDESTLLF
ncbi:MliC family protein [Bartonella senegalensis]|uniref:MliC family protein n=1 Tax=Bartonella senegalensis TaxID=1468418 RepID=UPI0002E675B1|nr:MliC family protein [Bartonella senegalensis]